MEDWPGVEGGRLVECAQEETGRARLLPWGPATRYHATHSSFFFLCSPPSPCSPCFSEERRTAS